VECCIPNFGQLAEPVPQPFPAVPPGACQDLTAGFEHTGPEDRLEATRWELLGCVLEGDLVNGILTLVRGHILSISFLCRGMWRATRSYPRAVQTTASSADPIPSIAGDLD